MHLQTFYQKCILALRTGKNVLFLNPITLSIFEINCCFHLSFRKSNKDIQAFMTEMGFGQNYSRLEEYYEHKFLSIVESAHVKPIVWQEVVDNGVNVRTWV